MVEITMQTKEDVELGRLLRDCMHIGMLKTIDAGLSLFSVMDLARQFNDEEVLSWLINIHMPNRANYVRKEKGSKNGKPGNIRQKR